MRSLPLLRRFFQGRSKSDFILLYGLLVRLHIEYGKLACSQNLMTDANYLEPIQILATTGW